jgi:DNA modification methylase
MFILLDINSLTLLERNPRKITKDQFNKLIESLKSDPEFFNARPLLVNNVDGKNIVYAGNQRLQAAKKLKWKQVPCIVEYDLEDSVMKSRIIKDNKSYGEFDYDILYADFDIETLEMAGFTPEQLTGDFGDLENPLDKDTEDEDVENKPVENPKTKLGDCYTLGDHHLVCGDSTDEKTVKNLLKNNITILMVTDPPYGVEYDASWRSERGGKISSGKVLNDDVCDWSQAWKLFNGDIAYVWHDAKFSTIVEKSLLDNNFKTISQIIWTKKNFAISRGDYHWKHEPCLYVVKNGKNHNWQGSRKETTVWEINVVHGFVNGSKEDKTCHSTQKPIECMLKPILNNTKEGENVYDPFLGSGTTLIACEMSNRNCYGLELNPAYCDVIVDRWVKNRQKNSLNAPVFLNGSSINWDIHIKS